MFGGPYQNTFNTSLAVNAGFIYLGGFTQDPALPTTPGALSSTCPGPGPTAQGPGTVCPYGTSNGYVAEFDPTQTGPASLIFATYLNGVNPGPYPGYSSTVNALAADSTGNVYAVGSDSFPDFPITPGVLQPVCAGSPNSCDTGFVTKLDPFGNLLWSTFYGSPSTAGGSQTVSVVALDANTNVYIAANATGLGDYLLNNGFQDYTSGSAYVTELSSDGTQVLFGSFFGGDAGVTPTGLAVDANGNIYLAGYTTDGLPLVNPYQSTNGGGYNEGFFAQIALLTAQTITFPQPADVPLSAGSTTLAATASSGLTVVYSSLTANVCTVAADSSITLLAVGVCTIEADQPGNGSFSAAAPVTVSFNVTAN
jgi:hypothetical protein